MDRSYLIGGWSLSMELDIVDLDARLAIAFPEAPPGFESDLVHSTPAAFRSAAANSTAHRSPSMLTRLDRPSMRPPGSGLFAPALEISDTDETRFRQVLGRLGDEIYDRLVSARRTDSGFEIVTTADSMEKRLAPHLT